MLTKITIEHKNVCQDIRLEYLLVKVLREQLECSKERGKQSKDFI